MRIISLALLTVLPSVGFGRYIDTRDISVERARVQALLSTKRFANGNDEAQAAAAAALAVGTGLVVAGAFTPRVYYRPSYYPYRGRYSSYYYPHRYRRGYYVSRGSGLGFAGAAVLAAGSVASAAAAEEKSANRRYNDSIESKIVDIVYSLVESDEDYLRDAAQLNESLSNRGASILARIDEKAQNELDTLMAPSNQMETRLKGDLVVLEAENLPSKAYNKALKKLNKQAQKNRRFFAKSMRIEKELILQEREETYAAFIEEANKEIQKLTENYFRQYHARLI